MTVFNSKPNVFDDPYEDEAGLYTSSDSEQPETAVQENFGQYCDIEPALQNQQLEQRKGKTMTVAMIRNLNKVEIESGPSSQKPAITQPLQNHQQPRENNMPSLLFHKPNNAQNDTPPGVPKSEGKSFGR